MKVRRWTSVLCELLWLELNHLKESLLSFIDIWDFAKHQTSSMIHQVECHSGISQDSDCCREQIKDNILYKVWVVWMNDDFFWASQCLKHILKIYQLSLAELFRWVLFSLCEWYSYLHWWVFASASKSHTKSTTTALRSQLTDWHW